MQYEHEVNPLVSLELSLRRRYFIECVKDFSRVDHRAAVFNLGAGYTSYPYIVDSSFHFCEVDLPSVIDAKRNSIAKFVEQGLLPARETDFVSADFNDKESFSKFTQHCFAQYETGKSIAIMEGLLYYLRPESGNGLFAFLRDIQCQQSRIILDYWEPSASSHPVFLGWTAYARDNYGLKPHDYTYHEPGFFEQLEGYRIIECLDFAELENRFAPDDRVEDQERHFPMKFVLLERR